MHTQQTHPTTTNEGIWVCVCVCGGGGVCVWGGPFTELA